MVKEYSKRFLRLMVGLFLCGTGSYITIQANIGLAPWDSLSMGLSYVAGLIYGDAATVISAVILLADIAMKEKIGIGTICNALFYPRWVDFWNLFDLLPRQPDLLHGLPLLLLGEVFIAFGTWLYMSVEMGSGPRDSLMVGVGKRLPKIPIGVIRGSLEALAAAGGFLMGAKIGLGTVVSALSIGFILQGVFALVKFEARSVRRESFSDTFRRLQKAG